MQQQHDQGGMSRRRMLAQTAAAGGIAWATPTILASPAAAASVSELPDQACGTVAAYGGDLVQIAPPGDCRLDALESDTEIRFWLERESTTIGPDDLTVDDAGGGTSVIPAGTAASVYFFHYDRGSGNGAKNGDITFSTPILGVVKTSTRLDDTDSYGAPGTLYPTGNGTRGLESDPSNFDSVTIDDSSTTLRLQGSDFDQVRVFVSCGEGSA